MSPETHTFIAVTILLVLFAGLVWHHIDAVRRGEIDHG